MANVVDMTADSAMETMVLGACLSDPQTASDLAGTLDASCFSDPHHARLWSAIQQSVSAGQAGALATIKAHCPNVSYSELVELSTNCPSVTLGAAAGETLKVLRDRRALRQVGLDLASAAGDPSREPSEVIAEAASALSGAFNDRAGSLTLGEVLPSVLEQLARLRDGVPGAAGLSTGIQTLDSVWKLRPGEVSVLAARPSIGKSALAAQIGLSVARSDGPVLLVSLEMPAESITARLVSAESGVSAQEIELGAVSAQAWSRVEAAREALSRVPLRILSRGRCRVADIAREARAMQRREGLALVVIDYLQLVTPSRTGRSTTRESEVASISADTKAMALQLGVPILALAQLSRLAEGEAPKLHHLRESGSLEQDADVVALLHRERGSAEAVLGIAKSRNGRAGVSVPLSFDARLCRFEPRGVAGL